MEAARLNLGDGLCLLNGQIGRVEKVEVEYLMEIIMRIGRLLINDIHILEGGVYYLINNTSKMKITLNGFIVKRLNNAFMNQLHGSVYQGISEEIWPISPGRLIKKEEEKIYPNAE